MIIVLEKIHDYCKQHEKDVPYGHHLTDIGIIVAEMVRQSEEKYEITTREIQIPETTMVVNQYPEEAAPILEKVIDIYFNDRKQFHALASQKKKKDTALKFFNYDIPEERAPIFESALEQLEIPIHQNHCSHGKAQYRVPVVSPIALIKLGIMYQKFKAPFKPAQKRKRIPLQNDNENKNPDIK